jgi:hypothetical protein
VAGEATGDDKVGRRPARGRRPSRLLPFFAFFPPLSFSSTSKHEIQRFVVTGEVQWPAPLGFSSPVSAFPSRECAPPSSRFAVVPSGPKPAQRQ